VCKSVKYENDNRRGRQSNNTKQDQNRTQYNTSRPVYVTPTNYSTFVVVGSLLTLYGKSRGYHLCSVFINVCSPMGDICASVVRITAVGNLKKAQGCHV